MQQIYLSDKNLISNCSPVSIIPVLAKVFEGLVLHQVYEYLEQNGLFNDVQSSFRQNCSNQDILLWTVADWKTVLDLGLDLTAVMIDMSKAFDTENHALLIDKLQAYRIWEGELLWSRIAWATGNNESSCMELYQTGMKLMREFLRALY